MLAFRSYSPSEALHGGSEENMLLMTSASELQILDFLLLNRSVSGNVGSYFLVHLSH